MAYIPEQEFTEVQICSDQPLNKLVAYYRCTESVHLNKLGNAPNPFSRRLANENIVIFNINRLLVFIGLE